MSEEDLKRQGFVPVVTVYMNEQGHYKVASPPGVFAAKIMAVAVVDFLNELQQLAEKGE